MNNDTKVYFIKDGGSFAPGSVISVGVYVDSRIPVNAFDISLIYEKDKLEFLGSDNDNSIVDIWQTKPEDEVPGVIEFSGGILDSFSGVKGSLVKFSFKVLETTNATDVGKISFTKGDFYLADGNGTKVTAFTSDTSVSIKEEGEVAVAPFTPFQSTESDVLIEQGLKDFKSQVFWEKAFTPLIYFLIIIFVICAWAVYNKYKRKP